MFDKEGVIHAGRTDLEENKYQFATAQPGTTLSDALKNADVFVGLSVGNVVTAEMVETMAKNPIVFAMANPDPEISYEAATAARKDIIMATGRSRLPQPGKQCTGVSFYISWCPGRQDYPH